MMLSMIIAGYRHPEVWQRALDSVKGIPIKDMEFLCIEDGGGDERVMELLHHYQAEDSRFVPIYRENGGVCCARNTGLDIAKGKYITFMDYDDKVNTEIYSKAIAFLEAHPDCDICTFGVNTVWPDIRLQDPVRPRDGIVIKSQGAELYYAVEIEFEKKRLLNFIWNKLYRRTFIEQNNLRFEPHSVCFEDIVFNLQCLIKGATIGGLKKIGYLWLRPSSGSTLGRYRKWDEEGTKIDYDTKLAWAEYCGVAEEPDVVAKLQNERIAHSKELVKNMYRSGSPYGFIERCMKIQKEMEVGALKSFLMNVIFGGVYFVRNHFYYNWVRRIKMRSTFKVVKPYTSLSEIIRN